MGNKKTSGLMNYINVSPNNGLGNSVKNKNSNDMMEGSGDMVYQPFNGSQNILRISTTTTTTTTSTTTTTTTTTPRTTPRTTERTNPPEPVTPDPSVRVYGGGAIVRNNWGSHLVIGK